MDRPAHRHPHAPLARAGRGRWRRWPPRPAPTRWPTPAATPAEVDRDHRRTITPDQAHARASRRWSPTCSAPGGDRGLDLNAACAGFLVRARRGRRARRERPRARRPGLRRRGAVAASPTTTTAAPPCCSATAPARSSSPAATRARRRALRLGSDAAQARALYVEPRRAHAAHGRPEVYRHAVARMVEATGEALDRRRARPSTTSTCSSPTRPTRASSRPPPPSSALRLERVALDIDRSPTRRRPRSRWRSSGRARRPPAARREHRAGRLRRRLRLERGRRALEGARACLRVSTATPVRSSPAGAGASAPPIVERLRGDGFNVVGLSSSDVRRARPRQRRRRLHPDRGGARPDPRARQQRRHHPRRPRPAHVRRATGTRSLPRTSPAPSTAPAASCRR